ncbi:MAG: DUF4126 domain-containing protein [Burkholderiales bacterium]
MDNLQSIALAAGLGWASGIRLYAVLFIVGLVGKMGWAVLPQSMQVLSHPLLMGATGFMLFVEFFADKIPGLDTIWDAVHTFIRIPAGAALAASMAGADSTVMTLVAGILGGAMATGSHLTKAGSRALINTSPEPVTNWTASLTEDALVVGGLWTMFTHPAVFLVGLGIFIILAIWLLPKLWRALKSIFSRINHAFDGGTAAHKHAQHEAGTDLVQKTI